MDICLLPIHYHIVLDIINNLEYDNIIYTDHCLNYNVYIIFVLDTYDTTHGRGILC